MAKGEVDYYKACLAPLLEFRTVQSCTVEVVCSFMMVDSEN